MVVVEALVQNWIFDSLQFTVVYSELNFKIYFDNIVEFVVPQAKTTSASKVAESIGLKQNLVFTRYKG